MTAGEGLVGDAHILPACAIGVDEGDLVRKYLSTTSNPTATIDFPGTLLGIKPAPIVASFSGGGLNGLDPNILKSDLIAPGVNILAAWTDAIGPSIAAWFSSAKVGATSKNFLSTVINVGEVNAVYTVKVESPKGVTVVLKPTKVAFTKKLSYVVKPVVRSPIVVTLLTPL